VNIDAQGLAVQQHVENCPFPGGRQRHLETADAPLQTWNSFRKGAKTVTAQRVEIGDYAINAPGISKMGNSDACTRHCGSVHHGLAFGLVLQAHQVTNDEASPIRQLDDTAELELGQVAANRFDREPEVIGDIGAAHRQVYALVVRRAARTSGQRYQEASDAFHCRFAAQQNRKIVHGGDFASSHCQQLLAQLGPIAGGGQHIAPGGDLHTRRRQRVAIEAIVLAMPEADDIAGISESDHLPTTIGEHLGGTEYTADHFIERIRLVALVEQHCGGANDPAGLTSASTNGILARRGGMGEDIHSGTPFCACGTELTTLVYSAYPVSVTDCNGP